MLDESHKSIESSPLPEATLRRRAARTSTQKLQKSHLCPYICV
jgi:hypothetical protein